jgi:hypothetical protein
VRQPNLGFATCFHERVESAVDFGFIQQCEHLLSWLPPPI